MFGLDIHKKCIEKCQQIQKEHLSESSSTVTFSADDIDGKTCNVLQHSYGVIHCGFFVAEALHNRLVGRLAEGGIGVWPISVANEQRLHLFTNEGGTLRKDYLISTLFSEQRKILS